MREVVLLKNILILLITLTVIGCSISNSEIEKSDKLTVEGEIREGEFAEIFLSNSILFEGIIDSLTVAKSVESKAKITLTNGEVTEVLTLKKDDSRFPFLFYRSNLIKGEIDGEYNLTVNVRGKEFNAYTKIPKVATVEDITFLQAQKDGLITPGVKDVRLLIRNRQEQTSYYKILIKNENESKFEFASPFIVSTENVFTETFPIIVNYNTFTSGSKESLLFAGEVFEIKLIAIAKAQFDFWKKVRGEESDIIENAAFTQEVPSNISNGAFGYWSGENVTAIKFKIPK